MNFGFVLHPMDARRDAARRYPIAKYLPGAIVEQLLARKGSIFVSDITGVRSDTGATTEGCFVGCPLTPRMMKRMPLEECYKRIVATVEMAAEHGAKVVGLGAFTAVIGDGGITVAERSSVAVTTGNSYTVATAIEGALEAARVMAIRPCEAKLAVVGATGSIGKTCAQIMVPQFAETVLIGRDRARTEAVIESFHFGPDIRIAATTDVAEGLRDADVIITVTSAAEAIIHPHHLKTGAVVCDVARPRDVSRRVADKRNDVLVVEGGVVSVPGDVEFGFDFGFPPRTAYACMCETMILALEERAESFTVGKDVSVEQVREMSALAQKHGFRLAGFRSFERAISNAEIERIARNAGRFKGGYGVEPARS
jgi:fatty aldehyde-generating acyl-ACP reductase